MDKKVWVPFSLALAGGVVLVKYLASKRKPGKVRPPINWAGNLTYCTDKVHYPTTVEQVQTIIRQPERFRALGSKHSFNTIADSKENLISLQNMSRIVSLDQEANTVTVEGGMRYGELAVFLHENGYAVPNMASLPHITVVGACSTATHGSGIQNGNLATSVAAVEFVNAAGELVSMSRQKDGEVFNGAVVALGALGVVTKITLDLVPSFQMTQVVYRNMPMQVLKDNLMEVMSKGYSVSLFTNWKNLNINQVWIKDKTEGEETSNPDAELFGAKLATQKMHPIDDQSAENATDQLGVPGYWFERLPHFKMGFKPSAGAELQSEYFVPLEHGYEAMMAIASLQEKLTPHLFISEIRAIKADELWLSPQYQQTTIAFHFTWKQEVEAVMALLPLIEEQLAPFNPRPHWGKLFTMAPAVLQSRYEKLAAFKQLLQQHDPEGKFRNDFLHQYLYSAE